MSILPLRGSMSWELGSVPGVTVAQVPWYVDSNNAVSNGYFDAMGLPLVAGRTFAASDSETSPLVAIVVSESMVRIATGRPDPSSAPACRSTRIPATRA